MFQKIKTYFTTKFTEKQINIVLTICGCVSGLIAAFLCMKIGIILSELFFYDTILPTLSPKLYIKINDKEMLKLYKVKFDVFLNSEEYSIIEQDEIYLQLRTLLKDNLPLHIFLDVEELLHEEIIFKMHYAFKSGHNCCTK